MLEQRGRVCLHQCIHSCVCVSTNTNDHTHTHTHTHTYTHIHHISKAAEGGFCQAVVMLEDPSFELFSTCSDAIHGLLLNNVTMQTSGDLQLPFGRHVLDRENVLRDANKQLAVRTDFAVLLMEKVDGLISLNVAEVRCREVWCMGGGTERQRGREGG